MSIEHPGHPALPDGIELGAPFHCGIVVDDIDSAMATLGAGLGISWARVQQADHTYITPDGPVATRHRFTYSMGAVPHVELIEGEADSIWEPSSRLDLHHLGYWAEDLAGTAAALAEAGIPVAATLGVDVTRPKVFTYHQIPGSTLWIELVDTALRARFAPWLAGGDMLPRTPGDR